MTSTNSSISSHESSSKSQLDLLPAPTLCVSPELLHRPPTERHTPNLFTGERQGQSRVLRVTQKDSELVGGNRIQTRIEIIDLILHDKPIVFSVKHSHDNHWERQLIIHKNILLASILAGVSDLPIKVPQESRRLFEKLDNPQHVHTYMERILPHIRSGLKDIKIFWWRATEAGSIILLNEKTGRLVPIPNKQRKLIDAAKTLTAALDFLRKISLSFDDDAEAILFPPAKIEKMLFMEMDPEYPTAQTACSPAEPESVLSYEEVRQLVHRWAVEKSVSPWLTGLVVRTYRRQQLTHFRYSLDMDLNQKDIMVIQVHLNEPLSRELQAFPVCMLPVSLKTTKQKDIYLHFAQSLWVLQKIFEFHREYERTSSEKQPQRKSTRFSVPPNGHSETPKAQKSKHDVFDRPSKSVTPEKIDSNLNKHKPTFIKGSQSSTPTTRQESSNTHIHVDTQKYKNSGFLREPFNKTPRSNEIVQLKSTQRFKA